MYKDHVLRSVIIIFIILIDLITPFLFLDWFYGSRLTDVLGDHFSNLRFYILHGYYKYIFATKYIHSSAMLALYFYLLFVIFLSFISFIWIKKIFFDTGEYDNERGDGDTKKRKPTNYYSKKAGNDLSLDMLDNTKKINKNKLK